MQKAQACHGMFLRGYGRLQVHSEGTGSPSADNHLCQKHGELYLSSSTYHLGYPYYVVVTATDEANQCLPSILLQYSHACEFWRFLFEIRICGRPLLVQFRQIRSEIEVVVHQGFSVIVFERGYCRRFWRRGGRCQWSLGFTRKDSFVVQMRRVLA